MSAMKRRHFLQFASSSLAAMGLSQLNFTTQAEQYGKVLAQPTARKLALLVGINNYPNHANLRGCLTDVELQYHLLVHRFGFNPADIVQLTDTSDLKPNRENILQLFQTHLLDQAKAGDVVVFHYSGHGSRVIDPHPIYPGNAFNGTLSPNDPLPATSDNNQIIVPDIMGRTMFLLMRSLQTRNVTAILDSCHSGGGLRGNTVVRAMPESARGNHNNQRASQAEFDLQARLMNRLKLSFEDFQSDRVAGITKGLGIGSAQFNELALDMAFDGFHAGAFTYLLTRYLWQMAGSTPAETVRVNLERSTRTLAKRRDATQIPAFYTAPNSQNEKQTIYFTAPTTGPAEAVVTEITGNQVKFWLGGTSSQFLEAAAGGERFTVLSADRAPVGEVVYQSRSHLSGIGQQVAGEPEAITPGMLLREKLVGLPTNPQLKVGIDPSLAAEQILVQQNLNEALVSKQTGQNRIVASPVNQTSTFDYIIGKMTETHVQQLAEEQQASNSEPVEIPPIGSILLFTPTLAPVPGTDGPVGESVSEAVNRLKAKLKTLLAAKVLASLTVTTSALPLEGEIFAASGKGPHVPIGEQHRQQNQRGDAVVTASNSFKAEEDIKIRVVNNHTRQSLYLSCIAIDDQGDMTVIYPVAWDAPDDAALMPPNSELLIPRPEDEVNFRVNGSGYIEILTLVSTGSLRNALRGLQEIARSRGATRDYLSLRENESLSVLEDLLGDVDNLSRGGLSASIAVVPADNRKLIDRDAVAAVSTVIEVKK